MDRLAQQLANQAGMGAAAAAPARDDLNGLDSREVVDIRFFLRPEELDEATAIRKVSSNEPGKKVLARTICAIGAVYAVLAPYIKGASWSQWWAHRPELILFWGGLLVLDIYVVLGQPGLKKLNYAANRLNVERRICVSHRGIDITHGKLRQQKSWSDFSFYQETPTIFVLQTTRTSFWTLPKRAIPAGRGDQLVALLRAKLRQR